MNLKVRLYISAQQQKFNRYMSIILSAHMRAYNFVNVISASNERVAIHFIHTNTYSRLCVQNIPLCLLAKKKWVEITIEIRMNIRRTTPLLHVHNAKAFLTFFLLSRACHVVVEDNNFHSHLSTTNKLKKTHWVLYT